MGDKEAAEARKIPDKIVVYGGDADLASIDPDVAAKANKRLLKKSRALLVPALRVSITTERSTSIWKAFAPDRPRAPSCTKRVFTFAAKAEPARVSALAGRVVALAKAGTLLPKRRQIL